MTEHQPDIEIYVKRVARGDILEWLAHHFEVAQQQQVANTLKLKLVFQDRALDCRIVEKAAEGGYCAGLPQAMMARAIGGMIVTC